MSNETEQRVMLERRPQGPPPTPRNPALESAESLMRSGETAQAFRDHRKPFELAWAAFIGGQLDWKLRA